MQSFCLPCNSLQIDCGGCILGKVFPPSKLEQFELIFVLFSGNIEALRSKLEKIPPQLRQTWITLKPLPVVIPPLEPFQMPAFNNDEPIPEPIIPCYPCGILNPNNDRPCVYCPLAVYFNETNLEIFENLLLSHNGDVTSLRNEIVSFVERENEGDHTVQFHIDQKLAALWEIGLALESRDDDAHPKGRETGVALEKFKGKVDRDGVEIGVPLEKGKGKVGPKDKIKVDPPFNLYFNENNEVEALEYDILLNMVYNGRFEKLLADYKPYITDDWNEEMNSKLRGLMDFFWKGDGGSDGGKGGVVDAMVDVADGWKQEKVEKLYFRKDGSGSSGWKHSSSSKFDEKRKLMAEKVIVAVESIAAPTADDGMDELARTQAVLRLLEAALESAKARLDLLKKAKE